ncbi:unnamed protein product [Rotaria sp. Silwood2]|nr:unnamed protein product [Rotaria sp. Silwood2]CAF2741266.1 unnamed protein product [Rotaria sp. Silwood2]CAF3009576.1 unnamed protein product [Rotaria sp. Silwood2]CAF3928995.1 unnamed protein product [Rotaria sp. Silwood2]CAF4048083.1 unnamed protein product [Rotaria sp. Silwood2]
MFGLVILFFITIHCVYSQTELTLPTLPYAYNALEPIFSEHLMRLHYDKHFQTYTNKSNIVLKTMFTDTQSDNKLKEIVKQPIEVILTQLQNIPYQYQLALRYNGGGYFNHKLFFSMLKKPTVIGNENKPMGPLLQAIEKSFGSFDKFKELFSNISNEFFGSGWIWLYIDAQTKHLVLNYTVNQDNPIMYDKNHIILLCIDLWEHAYYPVYENRRNEYVENFWRLVNWPFVSQLYIEGQTNRSDL